jgi:hypothetical protein
LSEPQQEGLLDRERIEEARGIISGICQELARRDEMTSPLGQGLLGALYALSWVIGHKDGEYFDALMQTVEDCKREFSERMLRSWKN